MNEAVQAIQTSCKIFFCFFYTSFDRFLAVDHKYLLFSRNKILFPVEKYEILERCLCSRKTHPFAKCAKFSILFFFFPYKIIFSDSASQTESRKVFKSTLDPRLLMVAHQISSNAPRRDRFCKRIKSFYVNDNGKYLISFDSSYHHLQSYRALFFSFLSFHEKSRFYWHDGVREKVIFK